MATQRNSALFMLIRIPVEKPIVAPLYCLLKSFFRLLSALQSYFLVVPGSACHVNFDGVLDNVDGRLASEDSLAFSEDSLSLTSSFFRFRSTKVLSTRVACTSIYTCIQLGMRSHDSFTLITAFIICNSGITIIVSIT